MSEGNEDNAPAAGDEQNQDQAPESDVCLQNILYI